MSIDPPFALKLRNICLDLPSKLEIQTASAAKHSLIYCLLPIWIMTVPPDGISRPLAVMQLVDNTFPTDLISCKPFIQSEQVLANFGILSERFPPNLGKIRFQQYPLCITWAFLWDSKQAPGQFKAIQICCIRNRLGMGQWFSRKRLWSPQLYETTTVQGYASQATVPPHHKGATVYTQQVGR